MASGGMEQNPQRGPFKSMNRCLDTLARFDLVHLKHTVKSGRLNEVQREGGARQRVSGGNKSTNTGFTCSNGLTKIQKLCSAKGCDRL